LLVLKKLSSVPIVRLKRFRRELSAEVRHYIGTLLLQKDGLRSSFVPGDLHEFMEDNISADMTQAFGKKFNPERRRADIPEGFGSTAADEILGGVNMEPKYLPSNFELDYSKIK
tara:strand:+ start:191 stop:532 length:342 start_codon:yes stop_codon:yes gene_type:complete